MACLTLAQPCTCLNNVYFLYDNVKYLTCFILFSIQCIAPNIAKGLFPSAIIVGSLMKPLLALYFVTSTLNQHDSDSQCLCYSSKHLKYRQKMSCWFGISPPSSRIWDMLPQTGRWCHSESVFEFAWVVSLRHTQAKLGAGLLRNRERSRNSGRRSTTFEYKQYKQMSSLAWSKSV